MVQIFALQTERAPLAAKANKLTSTQFSSTLRACLRILTLYQHHNIFALFTNSYVRILLRLEEFSQPCCHYSFCQYRLLVTF